MQVSHTQREVYTKSPCLPLERARALVAMAASELQLLTRHSEYEA